MKINTQSPLKVLVLSIVLIFQFSCSKDSDLLADYILAETQEGILVDDIFVVSLNGSTVLDVLANDGLGEEDNITITDASQPDNGNATVNEDNTITYTPETTRETVDTFTYTTEVVNPDETVSTEQGTVTITFSDRVNEGEIVLNSLKAFPSAFGSGINITGGRGQSIYEVTNLNDHGSGSWRDAISQSNRIIIIKVEGRVDLANEINQVGSDNLTVWGQFAPGKGLTISGGRHTITNSHNHIFRFMTFQNKVTDGFGSFGVQKTEGSYVHGTSTGHYLDHLSTRYGIDQVLDLISREAGEKSTVAYCIAAEGVEGHNTGSIIGHSGITSQSGQITFARNMYYNISHRFPNMGGDGGSFEIYNNYISNWQQRMSAVNGAVDIDYFNNYADKGNHGLGSSPVNKIHYVAGQWGSNQPLLYSANNIVETRADTPEPAPQKSVWAWRKTAAAVIDGDPVVDGEQVDSPSLYTTTQQHNFAVPPDGYWDVYDVPAKVQASVGHNRGINADGSPGFFRDNKDADYINKSEKGTTESSYRTSSQWDNASFTGTALYADTDGDFMPDWFENQHGHLSPNDASDRDTTHISWNFENYTVTNNAKYTNLEICAEFYAGGFETMLDGTND